jgi:hypothetical protein
MPPDSDVFERALDAQEGVQREGAPEGGEHTPGKELVTTQPQAQQPAVSQPASDESRKEHEQQGQADASKRQEGRVRPTEEGNLVDAQGNVIARAGRERRLYEQQRAVERAVTPLRQELDQTRAQLQAFREAAVLPQQLGLNPQDVTTAMQFMSHWRRDPVGAARNMLTELKAAGYNVDELGSTVDAGAIRRMVMDAIAPFQQDREAERQRAEQQAAVQQEVQTLFADMPWTRTNQKELALVLEADPNLPLRDAAYRLQLWAVQNGYDIWQPLAPQHEAAQAAATQQQAPPQQQPVRQARAPGPPPSAGNIVQRMGSSLGHDRSTRDIVRESLREAGINVE